MEPGTTFPAPMAAPAVAAPAVAAWREKVLSGLLTVATVLAPPLVALSLLVRASTPDGFDVGLQLSAALLLPVLLVARRIPAATRAALLIGTLSTTSVWVLTRVGFVAGVGVALVFSSVLAVVFFGRRFGFVLTALQALAVFGVGLWVARGGLTLAPVEVDPMLLRNWIRMAGTTTLLAALLATVIDFVIGEVEGSARVTTETLASLRLAYAHLGRLHRRLDVAREEERGFLSRELHDELGQVLTALKLRLQLEGSDAHRDTIALIDQLIARVRRLFKSLRPPLLDEAGLVPALRAYFESESLRSSVAIDLAVDGLPASERLAPDVEIASFRAIQEAVGNALRHASARNLEVRLVVDATRLLISVRDDGRGFGTDSDPDASRGGLVAARERIRTRGGSFEVESSPGAGTRVGIELPIQGEAASSPGMPVVPGDAIAREPWRDSVRQRVVDVAAVVAPGLAALALFIAPSRRYPIDVTVLLGTGVLLPSLRLLGRWPISVRAAVAISVLFAAGIYVLARAGFGTGVSVLLATTCAVAGVCFGRRFSVLLIAIAGVAYLIVGVLVTRGVLLHDPAEVDPLQPQNWARLGATIALLAGLLVLVVDFVIRHVEGHARTARDALFELAQAYERLGTLHGSVEAAKEEERRVLAHELQDELAQSLTALKLRLRLADPPALDSAIAVDDRWKLVDPESLVDEITERLRRMSERLRPPLLDELGLGPALRSYLGGQTALSGITIDVEADARAGQARLPPDVEIACFRVVQESVTNAIRHARARHVQVRVAHDPGQVMVVVRDDGRGFDIQALAVAAAGGHLGVVGMRGRVHTLGGVFHLRSEPGSGTIVEVVVPLVMPLAVSPASAT